MLAFPIWGANLASGDAWSLAEEAALRQGSISPWLELVKYIFGMSNHTLGLIFISILEKIALRRGTKYHEKLCSKKDSIRAHFLKVLGKKLKLPIIDNNMTFSSL